MTKKDLGVLLAIAFFAVVFSMVLSNLLFTPKSAKELKAQKIDQIQSAFERPDKKYFNSESINPTQVIQIGDSPNAEPF